MYKRRLQNSSYWQVIFSASESFLANLLLYFVMGTLCGLVFNLATVRFIYLIKLGYGVGFKLHMCLHMHIHVYKL